MVRLSDGTSTNAHLNLYNSASLAFVPMLSKFSSDWSKLPETIVQLPDLESFKSGLSTLTFEGFTSSH
jgi:hypothetical protein